MSGLNGASENGALRARRKSWWRAAAQRVRARRSVLVAANSPMTLVVMRPVLEALCADPRLDLYLTGKHHDRDDVTPLLPHLPAPERFRVVDESRAKSLPADLYLCADGTRYGKRCHARVLMFHGVSFKGRAITERAAWFHRVLLVGPYQRRRFADLGLFDSADPRLVDVGMPKLDALARGELDGREVRRSFGIDPGEPCVLYAPTWGDQSSLAGIGEALIEELARHSKVIVKLHDHHFDPTRSKVDWARRVATWTWPGVFVYREVDIVPALAAADVLVSDASSVSQEFTLLDRPILFVDVPELLDSERYRDTVDLDTWGRKGGEVIRTAAEAGAALRRCLDHPEEKSDVRRAIAEDLFYHPGRATGHALAAIYHELRLRPQRGQPSG